ncbi:SpaA isopeptide-forming pilin-related protein [Trueperella pyogenes]|uniref:SpaA isopeptide-forming pilin-related protein n=1 Tax=Trueperella pyogenes TaxID=1661 RepID=UPI0032554D7C
MASSKAATFRWLSTIALMTLCLALVVGMLPRIQTAHAAPEVTTPKVAAAGGNEASSSDGRIKVSVTANPTEVPAGGGEVTYTYTVTNTRSSASYVDRFWQDELAQAMFFSSTRSNVCDKIVWNGGYKRTPWGEYYLPLGATTTGTCTTTVTHDVTNTFDVVVEDYYYKKSQATASASVSVQYSEGSADLQCDSLWFSSGSPDQTANQYGAIGTISIGKSTYAATSKLDFQSVKVEDTSDGFPNEPRRMNGSAALAVDSKNPEKIYYIPRLAEKKDQKQLFHFGGLWLYDAKSNRNSKISDYDKTPNSNRLGSAPDGTLWSVGTDGKLFKFDTKKNEWTDHGEITPGVIGTTGSTAVKYTFNNKDSSGKRPEHSLDSGDLAFDGLGNMWLIGSTAKTATSPEESFLFTISRDELNNKYSGAKATMVGKMGEGRFNGIAFGADGTLYGTTRDSNTQKGGLHLIDKKTGSTQKLNDNLGYLAEDLGSCSLPRPELRIEKTAKPSKAVTDGGEIEYTVKIENTGNLEATGVNFKDMLSDHKMSIVPGSATLNGEKWEVDFTRSEALVKSKNAQFLGTIAAGDTATIKFRTKGETGQTKVCNSAVVNFTGNPERKGILTDDPNTPVPNDPTCTPVYNPAIGIDKKGVALTSELGEHEPKSVVWSDDRSVRYIYYVGTDPNQPKGMAEKRDDNGYLVEGAIKSDNEKKRGTEDLKDVVVKDDKCEKVDAVINPDTQKNIGDRNSDGLLNPDELWQYQCVQENLSLTQPIKNTATVTATSVQSNRHLKDTDTWTVEPVGFKVEKTAKVAGENGSVEWKPTGSPIKLNDEMRGTATYRVTVTNTGLVDTFAPTVKDVFTTPKGFVLDKLSWTEVDASNQATGDKPRENSIDLPKVRLAKGQSKTFEITADVHVEDANQVDWEKVGQCKTDNGGESEYGLFNRVTMSKDADGEDNNDACVPVTSPLLEMSVTKLGNNCDTDQQTCELPGASFAIYDADPASAGAKPLADGVVVDKDKPSRFTSKGLVAGTYWLVETAAPNGHVLMAEPVQFQLTFDGIKILSTTANATVAENDKFNLRVVDQTAGELPKSGGNGHMPFIVAGVLLVLIGTIGYLQTSGCGPARVRNRKGSQQRI